MKRRIRSRPRSIDSYTTFESNLKTHIFYGAISISWTQTRGTLQKVLWIIIIRALLIRRLNHVDFLFVIMLQRAILGYDDCYPIREGRSRQASPVVRILETTGDADSIPRSASSSTYNSSCRSLALIADDTTPTEHSQHAVNHKSV